MTTRDGMVGGRGAVVTGGVRGIGLAIAAELVAHGARVAVGSRRGSDPRFSAAAREVVGENGIVAELDVQAQASIDAFMRQAVDAVGTVDILINAAGISVHHGVDGHDDADWQAVLDVNLSGPFRMIRACLPSMKARRWGRIVNIASTAARAAAPTHAAYCASKAGLVGLTRAVALEGAPHGITCIAISPGWVETEMLRESAATMAASSGRSTVEEIAAMKQNNPQNRLLQPNEIAALSVFCCSQAARGITMEDIQINAGAIW